MLITPHFTVEEFGCHSGEPYPPALVDTRLRPLCLVLERIRDELWRRVGREVSLAIISGYRSPKWNARVGGAKASRHMAGDAADVRPNGCTVEVLHRTARDLHLSHAIRIGGLGRYQTWVHIDTRPGEVLARWNGSGVGSEDASA